MKTCDEGRAWYITPTPGGARVWSIIFNHFPTSDFRELYKFDNRFRAVTRPLSACNRINFLQVIQLSVQTMI